LDRNVGGIDAGLCRRLLHELCGHAGRLSRCSAAGTVPFPLLFGSSRLPGGHATLRRGASVGLALNSTHPISRSFAKIAMTSRQYALLFSFGLLRILQTRHRYRVWLLRRHNSQTQTVSKCAFLWLRINDLRA
jgi:hypothetical protein